MKVLHLPSGSKIVFGKRNPNDNEYEYSFYIWPEDLQEVIDCLDMNSMTANQSLSSQMNLEKRSESDWLTKLHQHFH